jgi:acetylornithine deacetylase
VIAATILSKLCSYAVRSEILSHNVDARHAGTRQSSSTTGISFVPPSTCFTSELSVYPDECRLQYERRTVGAEDGAATLAEAEGLLADLVREVPDVAATARLLADRPAYALDPAHRLPAALRAALGAIGRDSAPTGMSFWTDAAVLDRAGIPAVLFGPGGAGLHSAEEYVLIDDVHACRDVLVDAVRRIG